MAPWPEALCWIAVGMVLRSVPRMMRVLFATRHDYLPFSRERKQMWAKDGTL